MYLILLPVILLPTGQAFQKSFIVKPLFQIAFRYGLFSVLRLPPSTPAFIAWLLWAWFLGWQVPGRFVTAILTGRFNRVLVVLVFPHVVQASWAWLHGHNCGWGRFCFPLWDPFIFRHGCFLSDSLSENEWGDHMTGVPLLSVSSRIRKGKASLLLGNDWNFRVDWAWSVKLRRGPSYGNRLGDLILRAGLGTPLYFRLSLDFRFPWNPLYTALFYGNTAVQAGSARASCSALFSPPLTKEGAAPPASCVCRRSVSFFSSMTQPY